MSTYREKAAAKIAEVVAVTDPLAPLIDLKKSLRAARPANIMTSMAEFRIWMKEENNALKAYAKLRAEVQATYRTALFPSPGKE